MVASIKTWGGGASNCRTMSTTLRYSASLASRISVLVRGSAVRRRPVEPAPTTAPVTLGELAVALPEAPDVVGGVGDGALEPAPVGCTGRDVADDGPLSSKAPRVVTSCSASRLARGMDRSRREAGGGDRSKRAIHSAARSRPAGDRATTSRPFSRFSSTSWI
ncbi:hypothetical protein D3C85_1222690 [compost metagenome]